MLKTYYDLHVLYSSAYHLGEGRVLKTDRPFCCSSFLAYHLGEGRVLKTGSITLRRNQIAYHLGEGRVLKTW